MNEQHLPIDQARAAGAQYLLNDLELANTFMNIAASRPAGESAQREYEVARRAYDQVASYLMRTTITRAEHEQIVERMRALAERLREFELRTLS